MAILPKQDRQIESLEAPKGGPVDYYGEGKDAGLVLRITPKGTKTWYVPYYIHRKGEPRRSRPKYKVGRYPTIGLKDARTIKLDILARVEKGEDPHNDRKVILRKNSIKNIDELCTEFFNIREKEKYRGRIRRNVYDEKSMTKCYIIPAIGSKAPQTVNTDDIELLLSKAQLSCSAVRANRILALLRVLFKYALSKKYVDINPTDDILPPAKENVREIDPPKKSEIKELWNRIENGVTSDKGNPILISPQIQIVLKLLLLTGQRSVEVSQAPIDEFDLEDRVWIISGERTKNGKPHKIPLTDKAMELVYKAIRLSAEGAPDSPYLFPGWTGRKGLKRGTISIGKTAPHHALKRVTANTKLNRFNVHDFRKICATQMAELGVLMEIVSEILNHSVNTVTARHYAKPSYLPQMREALELWSEHLMKIVED